ncbi:MAG: hypothetical protein JSS62_05100 [Verrucomicrobia bacterium]|nr:hypothetical protein [Verrucomicrobiota bacterium]MBS0647475.1 hypothetical protein [Verrucomicrobiota bacterium]
MVLPLSEAVATSSRVEHPHSCPCKSAALWCALVAISLLGIGLAAYFQQQPFQQLNTTPLFIMSGIFGGFSCFMLYYIAELKRQATPQPSA